MAGDDAFSRTRDQGDALGETLPLSAYDRERISDPENASAHARGEFLGRYVVLDRLGEGAMGAVYTAYDPELDRRIALKVLHHHTASSDARTQGQARLIREAKAMARLNHPNVIQVFDVGTLDGGDVYVAMEFVPGSTLTKWFLDKERSTDEILDVFLQAGRGLAHAHANGVVHRDFKPDNCLIDPHGRVRVIDFGIARHTESIDSEELEARAKGASASTAAALELAKTHAGSLIGTPAYMSFEQLEGREADARSDQFAFCVALYEALYKQPPFAGRGIVERMVEILEGRIRPIPEHSPVPDWLEPIVRRGLATEAKDRFASMSELLTALSPPQRRGGSAKWMAALVGLVAASIAATWVVVDATDASHDRRACAGLEAGLHDVWGDARRQELGRAFVASGSPHARDTLARVIAAFDERTEEWVAMRVDACEDTRVRGELTPQIMDLRMACLDQRLREMDTTLGVLTEARSETVDNAIQLISELPRNERCSDLARLEADAAHAPPPDLGPRIAELRQDLVRVTALSEAGEFARAEEEGQRVLGEARLVGWDPVIAEALLRRARTQVGLGDFRKARDALFEAAWRADRAGDRALEAEVWIDVVFVVGSKLREREAGLRWAQFARAQLEQTAEDPRLSARLEYYVALLQGALGHDREAYAGFQVAERYQRRAYDADDWRFATTYGAQASALSRLGRSEESFVMYRRAIDTMQRTLGPNHPSNGPLLNNYATALRRAGRLDEARRYFEQALAIKRQTLGEDHPSVAITIANLAEIQQRLGNYGEAADLYRQAREMRGRTLGESHSSYLTSVSCESSLALQRGDVPEATALAERALRGYEAQGEAYPIAQAETAYGEVLYRAGRASEAEPVLRRALAVYESTDVEPEPTAYPRTRLGAVLVELGRPAEAIEMLEAAERARGDRDLDPEERALTQYALGRALFESETDPLRGYRLVQQAEARFAQAGPPGEWALERVRGWLASHPEPMPLEVRN